MLRKLALSLAVAGAIGATHANALGLGEIRVNSALNEPLKAEIKLLQLRDLSPMQIRPRMADVDEFSLAGMSKSRFLTDVSFQVKVLPNGSGVIEMSSTAPIKEPFLNFLVEVNWPSGRLVREYTLLLDPPVFDAAPVPGAVAPAQAVVQPRAQAGVTPPPAPQASAPSARPAAAKPVNNIRTRMDSATEFYVDVRDTLWELAMRHRPDRSVSGEQMMLALLKKNPQAFPTGNINMLKAGVVMKVPTLDEIRQLSRQQAVAEVAHQTQLWKQGLARRAPVPAPQPAEAAAPVEANAPGKPSESASEPSGEADSQLKIVSPEEKPVTADTPPLEQPVTDAGQALETAASAAEGGDGTVTETSDLAQRNEDLENRLLMTQETVDKVERENQELNDKLDSIASQLDKMTRLMELRDQELATMQQRLQQAPQPDSNLVDDLTRNPGMLAGIGAALIAVLGGAALLLRRGRKKEPAQEIAGTDSAAVALGAAAAGAAAVAVASSDEATDAPLTVSEQEVAEAEASAEPESVVEEVSGAAMAPLAADDELDDDLKGLDLDMDLDLDEHAVDAVTPDDEFDLGAEDVVDNGLADADSITQGGTIDTSLDDLLFGQASEPESAPAESADESLSLDDDLLLASADEAEDDDLLELPGDLEFNVEKPAELLDDEGSAEHEDELSGLDFAVDLSADTSDVEKGDSDEMLEGFFDEDHSEGGGLAPLAESPDAEPLTDELLDLDDDKAMLDTVVASAEPEEFEVDEDLEEMLQSSIGFDEEEEDLSESEVTTAEAAEAAIDDLDALLASFEPEAIDEPVPAFVPEAPEAKSEADTDLDLDFGQDLEQELDAAFAFDDDLFDAPVAEAVPAEPKLSEQVEEELTANIAHDLELDLDLDSELDELLGSTDEDIALDDERTDLNEDIDDGLNLLEGADEVETKLDLARAYMEMDDTDGARDILNEIVVEGNPNQRNEAQKLLQELS